MPSKCQSCGVVGLTANDVDLAREIVGEGWETMCVPCAESYAKESKKFNAVKMVLDVMNDGSRIDRFLKKTDAGKFFVTDDSFEGIKIPVFYDSEPTEKDAEHIINLLEEAE